MESMINDPSFRDLVAKHFAEQMIAKSLMGGTGMDSPLTPAVVMELPAAKLPMELPAAKLPMELPAAKLPVELPAAAKPLLVAPTLTMIPSEPPHRPMEKALDYIPLERTSPKLDMPLEIIMSGKKRTGTTFREEPEAPLTARQLIHNALATANPVPYSICIKLNYLRLKLIPFLTGYTLDDLKTIKIDEFLTRMVYHAYDIFVERRPIINKLGVKLIPFGLHYYKYPCARGAFVKKAPYIDRYILDFIDNYVKEYIISTFLRIITDEDNCRYYNYSVKVHPNWKKEITFCQIYSISGIDLDHLMERMFDVSFAGI